MISRYFCERVDTANLEISLQLYAIRLGYRAVYQSEGLNKSFMLFEDLFKKSHFRETTRFQDAIGFYLIYITLDRMITPPFKIIHRLIREIVYLKKKDVIFPLLIRGIHFTHHPLNGFWRFEEGVSGAFSKLRFEGGYLEHF